jgi:hypothetical protein
VDSFFDITYRIDFVGAPGGPLAGMSGSTTGTIRMSTSTAQCVHTPVDCDDGNACTLDRCNPVTGVCEHAPVNCDDGDPCTLDACDPASGCVHRPLDCDDQNPCTLDRCEPAGCVVADDGTGTVALPPEGCGYVSPADLHRIIDGLPPGTTLEIGAQHAGFINITRSPGGSLGGELETFDSRLDLRLAGTGGLAGFSRTLNLALKCETHTGPRMPGDPVQSFATDMFGLQGQLPPGDPDFDLLRITAGTGFGLPSPGHTTLTQRPDRTWAVDSFFDITYRIDFVGAPGGPLAGMSGSTTGTIRMSTSTAQCVHTPVDCDDGNACTLDRCNPVTGVCEHAPVNCDDGDPCTLDACDPASGCVHRPVDCDDQNPCTLDRCEPSCVVTDDGTGTVALPPAGCGYVSPAEVHQIIDGLPPGTTIQVGAVHAGFLNTVRQPGGSLGGELETFDSRLDLRLAGTGGLAEFSRTLTMAVACETHTGPRRAGEPVQSFDTDMFRLQGQLPPGDPDFDLLRVTAGTGFGLPSPGHTTLTQLPGGTWAVDSFFDITYRIDFVGAPGGPLAGMSGSTTATIRMTTGVAQCVHDPVNCDDGDRCTLDACDPLTGLCVHKVVCEIDAFPNSLGQIDLRYPPSATTPHPVGLSGPTTVEVNLAALADMDGDGREAVPTEMTELRLSGMDPMFGPVVVRRRDPGVHPFGRTLGEIEETANYTPAVLDIAPFVMSPAGLTAQSFFDVFFEVELPALGLVLHNHVPKHLSGTIYHKPPAPGDTYTSPGFIDLYDDNETLVARAGPGYHIPNPPPQPPEIDIFSSSRAQVDIRVPAGSPQPHLVSLSGATSVSVALAALADPDGDGREQVPTEMLQLDLAGMDPMFGPVRVRLRDSGLEPFQRTRGEIEESANLMAGTLDLAPFNPAGLTADSFFDVFVEVELPALGLVLHTHRPKHMSGVIRYKPPTWGDWYESPETIPLYDANDNLVAELAPNLHVPNPCETSGQCNDNNPCTDDTCDAATGRCVYTNNDANACSDGDNCTVDRCANGACVGVPVNCDDQNPCTVDACDPATGQCVYRPVDCDDGNACTLDRCNPVTGVCEHAPVSATEPNPLMGSQPSITVASFTWPATPDATHYNNYRGSIPPTHLGSRPAASRYDHACFESDDAFGDGATTTVDPGIPPLGWAHYYFESGENACGESDIGHPSSGGAVPNLAPCPTPP